MLHYIIQTIAFQVLFLIVFDVFLKKETFFNYNRAYLLISTILSLILPFIKIDSFKQVMPKNYIFSLPEVFIGNTPETTSEMAQVSGVVGEAATAFSFSLSHIIYLGSAIALLVFIFKLSKVLFLIYKNPKQKYKNISIIELKNNSLAFSFFNYVFLGDKIETNEKDAIIAHEQVHVSQMHSLDLLFFELLRVFFWYNPLIYLYQKKISVVHEFVADAEAIKYNNKKTYYENLLSQVFDTKVVSFINPFFKESLIKKRIIMLSKNKSKQINLFKYTLLLPVVVGILLYTSCSSQKVQEEGNSINEFNLGQYTYSLGKGEEMSDQKKDIHERYEAFLKANKDYVSWATINEDANGITYSIHKLSEKVPESYERTELHFKDGNSYVCFFKFPPEIKGVDEIEKEKLERKKDLAEYNQDMDAILFANIEETPTYPECQSLTTNEEKKECFSNTVNKFVARNFNMDIGKDSGLIGVQKISTFFTITTTGEIANIKVRAPHPALQREAFRTIKALPKVSPGMKDGKPVNVVFFLPITLNIAE